MKKFKAKVNSTFKLKKNVYDEVSDFIHYDISEMISIQVHCSADLTITDSILRSRRILDLHAIIDDLYEKV